MFVLGSRSHILFMLRRDAIYLEVCWLEIRSLYKLVEILKEEKERA